MIPERIRKFENLHIVLWLLKDTCWVMDFKAGGIFMIFPTIAVAFYITYISRKNLSELFHNIAVCCWIMANSIWMTGEFFFDDGLRLPAATFFTLGLIAVTLYYSIGRKYHLRREQKKQTENRTSGIS
jgi:hypothetical protein